MQSYRRDIAKLAYLEKYKDESEIVEDADAEDGSPKGGMRTAEGPVGGVENADEDED